MGIKVSADVCLINYGPSRRRGKMSGFFYNETFICIYFLALKWT